MANIEVLKEYAETGESTHVMFKMASVEDRSNVQKSFEQINPEEGTAVIYKWLSNYTGRVVRVQLRVHNINQSIMHYIGLRVYDKRIYILYVHDLPSNQQQITHIWKPTTNYDNLTVKEIKESVTRAQETNYLTAQKQMSNNLSQIDALLESWLSEDKDLELSDRQ